MHGNRAKRRSLKTWTLTLSQMFFLFSVTGSLFELTRAGDTFEIGDVIISPQVIAGGEFSTTIVLSNTLFINTCRVNVTYEQGGGQVPSVTILTNGEDLGNRFSVTLPGVTDTQFVGSTYTTLEVTTAKGLFVGAVSFEIELGCENRVGVQTGYLVDGSSGFENFSFADSNVGYLRERGDCLSFPWTFVPGQRDVGVAIVARENPDTQVILEVISNQGEIVGALPLDQDYDGSHRSRLISEDFNPERLASTGSGALLVCARGASPVLESPLAVVALGVLQQRDPGPAGDPLRVVAFNLLSPQSAREGCFETKAEACLFRRYSVSLKDGTRLLTTGLIRSRQLLGNGVQLTPIAADLLPEDPGDVLRNLHRVSVTRLNERLAVLIPAALPFEVRVCITDQRNGTQVTVGRSDGMPIPSGDFFFVEIPFQRFESP